MHIPVLFDEVMEGLNIKEDGIYVDCTLGGAGHGEGICSRLSEKGTYIGFDKDTSIFENAKKRLEKYSCRKIFIHEDFKNFFPRLEEYSINSYDGIMADLGVSSFQLDEANRGFSFMHDGPLDMRMDSTQRQDAKEIVNTYSEEELANLIFKYGEERFSRRIAHVICEKRKENEISTTSELVKVIAAAVPGKYKHEKKHFATRTFQALRIEVNRELTGLEDAVKNMIEGLNKGGRVAIITFHSLEDRIIKDTLKNATINCICPPSSPVCTCNVRAKVKLINKKVIVANDDEQNNNPRARSAKLRIAEKL